MTEQYLRGKQPPRSALRKMGTEPNFWEQKGSNRGIWRRFHEMPRARAPAGNAGFGMAHHYFHARNKFLPARWDS